MALQLRSFAGGRRNNNSPQLLVSAPLVPSRQGLGPSQKASGEHSEMQESKGKLVAPLARFFLESRRERERGAYKREGRLKE